MRRLWPALALLAALAGSAGPARAQTEGLLQVEDEFHRFLERQQTLGRLTDAALGAKPLSAYEAHALLDSLARHDSTDAGAALSPLDRRLLAEYRGEAVGGLLGGLARRAPWLYRNGNAALSVSDDDFGLEAEPLAVLAYGPISRNDGADRPANTPETAWQNTRGARAAGHLDLGSGFGRVFFETRIEENQAQLPFPRFAEDTAPRLGFVRRSGETGYDYFVATGAVGYHTRRFEARFGRDRNRWGFGRESLVLSNYATVHDQAQLRWRVWRLSFTNLYTRFTVPDREISGAGALPQRYGAFHRLALDLGRGLEAEVFESIIFGSDSTGERGFEIAYLNPFQFYRGTERELGSPDNALLGAGLAWRVVPGVRLYGQGLLDDFKASRFSDAYWSNKWAYLLGAHVADPPVPGLGRLHGLDLRFEYARLRPYLYSHRSVCRGGNCPPVADQIAPGAYLHYGSVLGHPAGPNASDLAFSAHYRPHPDWAAALDVVFTRRGRNAVLASGAVVNYGSDPSVPFDSRPPEAEDQAETLWGIRQDEVLVEARVEARLLPQIFAGAALRYGSIDDAETGRDRYVAPQVMLRWGLPFPSLRY